MGWRSGEVVVLREIWWDRIWFAMPVIVVEDSDDLIAFYVPPGTEGRGAVRPPGKRDNYRTLASKRWELGPRTWERTRRLGLARPDEPYAVSAFWEGERFTHWYVDVIEPLRRSPVGFDFRDLELDVVFSDDGSWTWKDQDEVDEAVELGVFTPDDAAHVRRIGQTAVDAIESGEWWWRRWRDWAPDPSWPIPQLPDNWDAR